jgi:hypothetical protein
VAEHGRPLRSQQTRTLVDAIKKAAALGANATKKKDAAAAQAQKNRPKL